MADGCFCFAGLSKQLKQRPKSDAPAEVTSTSCARGFAAPRADAEPSKALHAAAALASTLSKVAEPEGHSCCNAGVCSNGVSPPSQAVAEPMPAAAAEQEPSDSAEKRPVKVPAPLDSDNESSGSEYPMTTSAPLGPDGLPSVGSADHATGECKRCCFFPRGRCFNRHDCRFCHYDHEKRRRVKKKKKRAGSELPTPSDGGSYLPGSLLSTPAAGSLLGVGGYPTGPFTPVALSGPGSGGYMVGGATPSPLGALRPGAAAAAPLSPHSVLPPVPASLAGPPDAQQAPRSGDLEASDTTGAAGESHPAAPADVGATVDPQAAAAAGDASSASAAPAPAQAHMPPQSPTGTVPLPGPPGTREGLLHAQHPAHANAQWPGYHWGQSYPSAYHPSAYAHPGHNPYWPHQHHYPPQDPSQIAAAATLAAMGLLQGPEQQHYIAQQQLAQHHHQQQQQQAAAQAAAAAAAQAAAAAISASLQPQQPPPSAPLSLNADAARKTTMAANAPEFVPSPSGSNSPRTALLTMCGAWGALANPRGNEAPEPAPPTPQKAAPQLVPVPTNGTGPHISKEELLGLRRGFQAADTPSELRTMKVLQR
eukprot:TRINITY_DN120701_c0_g1_i1.p1 TRINITY_DN120701_c0_g1~~TRINITY_DN120701_c0_g1_i1.p1  ORF type:complete len:593 (+),score=140.80 TRINITY_DN120701_c0_g1_i1:112-1890(+)